MIRDAIREALASPAATLRDALLLVALVAVSCALAVVVWAAWGAPA